MTHRPSPAALVACAAFCLAACGGGTGSSVTPPPEPSQAQRAAAATATAANNPKCSESTLGSYYWEIGDAGGAKASGSRGRDAPTGSTPMRIYSASKWLYSTFVLETRRAVVPSDATYLNFTSGYTKFGNVPLCVPAEASVQGCLLGRDGLDPATVGTFNYDSGHMQHHAAFVMGLGAASTAGLASALNAGLAEQGFTYWVAQPAAGAFTTPSDYARFLRRMLGGQFLMSSALGSNKVCAQSAVLGCTATGTPDSIGTEAWNYSLGHWVEDDPILGDHAFSSAGGGGFYPWIDATKSFYGIVARERSTESAAGYHSAECGRLLRQAWMTGLETTSTAPKP